MRYARVLIALGVAAAVSVSVILIARASNNRPAKAAPAAATTNRNLKLAVQREAQRLLGTPKASLAAGSPRSVPPKLARVLPLTPAGQTCFVAAGSCSENPCVVPVTAASGPTVTVGPGVAAVLVPTRRGAVVPNRPGSVVRERPGSVVPERPGSSPSAACPGRSSSPQTLSVSIH